MNQKNLTIFDSRPLIVAVVVTYFPDEQLWENMNRLAEQVAEIIIVDNGSTGAACGILKKVEQMPGLKIIRNATNLGIATALNIGIRSALQSGCQWVATFDQDTLVPPRYFEELLLTYEKCPASQTVGMIAPGSWSSSGPDQILASKTKTLDPAWSFVRAALNSGSVIKRDVFKIIGFYEDGLFLDYVDVEFCLRLQKNQFKILSVRSVVLRHELGTKQTRNLLGFCLSFRIHHAWRYYYIMRNRVVLYRRYLHIFPLWAFHDAKGLVWETGRIVFLENGRGPKFRAVVLGIRDGLRGNTGKHPNYP